MTPAKPKARRNPWPVAITVYFIIFTTFTVSMVTFVSRQPADMVSENYYDNEIRFQQQIDKLNRTLPFTNHISVAFDAARQSILISLPAEQARRQTTGTIHLYRPSDSKLDQDTRLTVDADGFQRVDARQLRAGLWKVRVEWNVDGEAFFFDQRLVVRPPQT